VAAGPDVSSPSDYPSVSCCAGEERKAIYIVLPTRREALRAWVAGCRRLDPMFWVLLLVLGAALTLIIAAAGNNFSLSNPILCLILAILLPIVFVAGVLKSEVVTRWIGHPRVKAAVKPIRAWMIKKSPLKTATLMEPQPPLKVIMELGAALDTLEYLEFAKHLAKSGYAGGAVLISRGIRAPSDLILPLGVLFEPMPLDECTAKDFALVGAPAGQDRDSSQHRSTIPMTIVQRIRRVWELGGLHWPLLVLLLAMSEIVYRRGSLSCGTLLFGVVASAVIVARLVRLESAAAAYIIPGGLIDRQNKRVYRFSSGLMIWRAEFRELYLTDVVHGDVSSFRVTRQEAVLAVRAWLSPVPGPSDELIESFLAGRS
jgi:hypothetical protein